MAGLLIRLFVRNRENIADPRVRRGYGMVCSLCGIGINVLLFLGKLITGLLGGSVAVVADAFNNLSDAGSSIVTLLGFRLAAQEPDRDHPYGHGRFEYISGMLVSVVILLMGIELLRSGAEKILHPQPVNVSPLLLAVLTASILLKLYMAYYNRKYGAKIASAAMKATAVDSLSDCAATGAVLGAAMLSHFTDIDLDGWAGALVAVFVILAGIRSLKETIDPLLGLAPDEKLVKQIYEIVNSHPETKGIHDLAVHDYGPGRTMISLHVEVDGSCDIYELHDAIDVMERELNSVLGCSAIIHMDPISVDGQQTHTMRGEITRLLREEVDERISIHDFRLITNEDGSGISFDTLIPAGLRSRSEEIRREICRLVEEHFEGCSVNTGIDVELGT